MHATYFFVKRTRANLFRCAEDLSEQKKCFHFFGSPCTFTPQNYAMYHCTQNFASSVHMRYYQCIGEHIQCQLTL